MRGEGASDAGLPIDLDNPPAIESFTFLAGAEALREAYAEAPIFQREDVMRRTLLIVGVLALLVPSIASADPKTGLGLEVGATQQSGDITVSGGGASGGLNYSSDAGLGLGIDFQFALSKSWSLGIFVEGMDNTSYSCTGCGSGNEVSSVSYGLDLRYWFDTVFLGLRALAINETFHPSGGGQSMTGNGAAAGVTAGWEGSSGVFAKIVYDSGTTNWESSGITYRDAVDVVRLFVGYRF